MLPLDLTAFGNAAEWDRLPSNVAELNIQATAANPHFPGGLLPVVTEGGRTFCYAAVMNAASWRRLRPLLLAYAGPTITTFSGIGRQPDPSRELERLLKDIGVFALAPLIPQQENVLLAFRALRRLVDSLACAPGDAARPPTATGTLLSRFDMCLATGDRDGAEFLLSALREEWRLNFLNLCFMETRLLAAFDDWSGLAVRPWFNEICGVSKPPSIASMLLEAIWQTQFAEIAGDEQAVRQRYISNVRPLCIDLLAEAPATSDAVSRIAALEATLSSPVHTPTPETAQTPSATPGWAGWANGIASGVRGDAAASARETAVCQPAATVRDVGEAKDIADLLLGLVDNDRRGPLIAALPTLVAWLQEDPGFPRQQMLPLYDAAMTLFAYLDDRGQPARNAMLALLDAVLSVGLQPHDYRRLLQDAGTFVEEEAGTATVYWLVELAETLIRHPGTNGAPRLNLLNAILVSMRPVLQLLTFGQRAAYTRVAAYAKWPPLPPQATVEQAENRVSTLAGRTIAIYTLTESAGRQARDALAELAPDVQVETSADHVCSPRLQALARNSDLFVITTSSAKHAATACIQRNRPREAPILYAAGRGVTSIFRAIEEHLTKQSLS